MDKTFPNALAALENGGGKSGVANLCIGGGGADLGAGLATIGRWW